MAKKTHRKKPSAEIRPAIVVEDPDEIITRVLKAFRYALGDKTIGFEKVTLARDEVRFQLSGSPIRATARDRYSVFSLLRLQAELFWLGAALVFKSKLGDYELKSISLVIFKGDAFDERKTTLFRAEWDNPEPGAIHAQPHWHVYPRFIENKTNLEANGSELTPHQTDFVDSETEIEEDEHSKWKTAANFHYAMSSRWALDGAGQHQLSLIDVEDLIRWINGCIAYSRDQLRWLFT